MNKKKTFLFPSQIQTGKKLQKGVYANYIVYLPSVDRQMHFLQFTLQKWYFLAKIILTHCEKKIVLLFEKNFEAEGREFENKFRSIHLSRERSVQFLKHNTCLTFSWSYLGPIIQIGKYNWYLEICWKNQKIKRKERTLLDVLTEQH